MLRESPITHKSDAVSKIKRIQAQSLLLNDTRTSIVLILLPSCDITMPDSIVSTAVCDAGKLMVGFDYRCLLKHTPSNDRYHDITPNVFP